MVHKLCLTFCFLTTSSIQLFAQDSKACASLGYEDKNQVTPKPRVVKKVEGRVIIKDGELPLMDACILLFDEETKRIVSVVSPNEKGEFRIKKVSNGKFRLVVRHFYNFYCVANIPIEIKTKSSGKGKILVNMKPSSIDDCSYGEIKD